MLDEFGLTPRIGKRLCREIETGLSPAQALFLFKMCQFFSYCEEKNIFPPNTRRAKENAIFRIAPYIDTRENQ